MSELGLVRAGDEAALVCEAASGGEQPMRGAVSVRGEVRMRGDRPDLFSGPCKNRLPFALSS